MKFLQYIKNKKTRILKIAGYNFYKLKYSKNKRLQRFFGGIISSFKRTYDFETSIKIVRYKNKKIFKCVIDENFIKKYFLNFLIYSKDIKKEYIKIHGKYIKNYKNIIILNAPSGETYLFLTYLLKPFLKKIPEGKTLIIGKKKYHKDLIKLIHPEINFKYIKNFKVKQNFFWQYQNYNFYTLFTFNHFLETEKSIKDNIEGKNHFFKTILNYLDIQNSELEFSSISICEEIKNKVKNKLAKARININRFVFILPEACSCREINYQFWSKLCDKLKNDGYDILFNITKKNSPFLEKYTHCNLSFTEAVCCASYAKKIFSLRSGITECFLQSNSKMFIIYTDFLERPDLGTMSSKDVIKGFNLSCLPNVNKNNLIECDINDFNILTC